MANFKRRKPRARTYGHISRREVDALCKAGSRRHAWMQWWPKWYDVLFHNRPKRRAEARELRRVVSGYVDIDAGLFPLGNNRPHIYYW
jgi:hypothetical protein